ncbi:MAG: DUF2868 domain-containing protein, partial [Pseudomonadales bacterium]
MDSRASALGRASFILLFVLGLAAGATVINGDAAGRVNLLYALLLFVIWPLVTLLLTLSSSLFTTRHGFSLALLRLPLWPRSWGQGLAALKRNELFKPWLALQSQCLSLSFSAGCLVAFLAVLLFNDITFVWRSTLLLPEQVYQFLHYLAYPWFYLSAAQPVLEGVAAAQQSRLEGSVAVTGLPWQFLCLAQLHYAIAPRALAWAWARRTLQRAEDRNNRPAEPVSEAPVTQAQPLEPLLSAQKQHTPFVLLHTQVLPAFVTTALEAELGTPQASFALYEDTQEEQALSDSREKVLVVPAWEPPLGELADFMAHSGGQLLALDWSAQRLEEPREHHVDEWRRFC